MALEFDKRYAGHDCALDNDSLTNAIKRALDESSLTAAFASVALWECDRAVRQAVHSYQNATRTPDGGTYETCFKFAFTELLKAWNAQRSAEEREPPPPVWQVLWEGHENILRNLSLRIGDLEERTTPAATDMRIGARLHALRELMTERADLYYRSAATLDGHRKSMDLLCAGIFGEVAELIKMVAGS